jgi:hypothetical protein
MLVVACADPATKYVANNAAAAAAAMVNCVLMDRFLQKGLLTRLPNNVRIAAEFRQASRQTF